MNRVRLPLLAFVLSTVAASAAAAQGKCDIESIRALAPKDAVIDSVKVVAAPVAHCEVIGHIITQNPGPNQVGWSLLLPDRNFSGRFFFMGQGGGAGQTVTASADSQGQGAGTNKLLRNGFAVSSSDTGHSPKDGGLGSYDFGANNPVRRLDYGHRGAHVSTVATQAMTRAYYGAKNKLYRYHMGCSGGGRMGMMAALHHPEDYDGIVASTVAKSGGAMYFGVILQHIVKHPENWVSGEKLAFLERKVDEKCAGPDGLVRDPYGCGFDVTTLQCKGADGPECLTAGEVSTVKVITSRFRLGNGEDADVPGFSISNSSSWSAFLLGQTRPSSTSPDNPWAPAAPPPSFIVGRSIARGMYFDNLKFDLINDLDYQSKDVQKRLTERHGEWGVTTPDLSGYKKAGGKLIIWTGMSENAVPPGSHFEYVDAIKRTVPGSDDFLRTYAVPGVLHCLGGPGPQDAPERLLDAVIGWAEEGKRPDALVVSGGGAGPVIAAVQGSTPPAPPIARTVLICPYPQKAVFAARKGAFPYSASNWKCE
jgi:feruloyl esterase